MSYVPIVHVATGDMATASLHNTLLDNMDFLHGGGLAIGSQANLDIIIGLGANQLGRVAKGTELLHLRMNAAANAIEWAQDNADPIFSVSGSDTSVGPTTLAAFVFGTTPRTTMTVKDTLRIKVSASSLVQGTAGLVFNEVGGATLYPCAAGGGLIANQFYMDTFDLICSPSDAANLTTGSLGLNLNTNSGLVTPQGINSTIGVAWTSTPSLSLRHAGVTVGGTLKWKIAIYKDLGQ